MPHLLIVTQCCKAKVEQELFPHVARSVLEGLDERHRSLLLEGRRRLAGTIYGGREVSALSMYSGHQYRVLDKQLVLEGFLEGRADMLIVSAGYGLVHAFEKVRLYEASMKKYGRLWMRAGLDRVLANYVENTGPDLVYGFFSRTGGYLDVFAGASRLAGSREIRLVTAEGCRGVGNVMRSLGYAINMLLSEGRVPKGYRACRLVDNRLK